MDPVTTLPRGRAFTEDDLWALPDDGNRYELVDGALIVTPSPITIHQIVVGKLYTALEAACPATHLVLMAPYDVRISATTVLQPDLVLARREAFGPKNLPGTPLLAVEVLSPSTRHIDLGLKRSRYEAAGCASYWVVDPDLPSVTAWEMGSSGYLEAGNARGAESLTLTRPFEVTVVPARLLG
jgi:Uma2 family endonuclease